MNPAQRQNLTELVAQLAKETVADKDDPMMSRDFRDLVDKGLHHVHMPESLHARAAESLQLVFEAMGGVPRMLVWADKQPGQFYKLFARMVIPTITPVLPPPTSAAKEEWPPYITAQRLAYRAVALPENSTTTEDPDAEV